jgi:hypothetical protein
MATPTPRTVGEILDDMPLPGIGHNAPPEPTPFEVAQAKVAEVRDEARMWLDGAPVTSQDQADGLAQLIDMARKAEKLADTNRKVENEPFDAGKAEVQARYKPLLADAERVKQTLLAASTAWLRKVDAEQRAAAEAKRIEAQRLADEARAVHAAANPVNLAEREAADAAIEEAERAVRIAKKAADAVPNAKGATATKAIGLRSYWTATITDPMTFARYLWRDHADEYLEWLREVAARMVAKDHLDLPGVKAVEEKRAA